MAASRQGIEPQHARRFAVQVVEKLRAAGHVTYWAGGCVRDQLLGKQPKDYDVATDAPPERIRELFGRRRTLAIGASFGVITVLGPHRAGQIEVATFRKDAAYSDGRHPDSVSFTDAEEDARRRDFTINGLFFDPLAEQVIDFVGGQEDLRLQVVRAIGDARRRFDEDKLRILRAVRFATTLDFELADDTLAAVREFAPRLTIVSAERIAAEMRRLLVDRHRRRGVELLVETELLPVMLPELEPLLPIHPHSIKEFDSRWRRTLAVLEALRQPSFPVALAALVRELAQATDREAERIVAHVADRWRLAGDERKLAAQLLQHEHDLLHAPQLAWPKLQRLLIAPEIDQMLGYLQAVEQVTRGSDEAVGYCRRKRALPAEQLNPPALLSGDDLIAAGFAPGPMFRMLLKKVRDAQLNGEVTTPAEALALAARLAREHQRGQNS